MKVPMSWFSDYVNIDGITSRDFAQKLTMSGSMVEGIEEQGKDIINVVTGRILKVEKHPDADKLVVCQVEIDEGTVQIVTGAPNVFEGAIIPVAKHGSTLPGGVKIKKGKLRGVESWGMMCSEEELGIATEPATGILILPDDTPVGKDIRDVLGLNECVVDFEITSNRPDCLSVIGLARETAVTYGRPFDLKKPVVKECGDDINNYIKINVLNKELCMRYTGRVVKNVKIKESPAWLKRRLEACGVRSINNIVDITNYVMLEYGQPMHAFDLRTIESGEINVRTAKNGEVMRTLDGVDHTLDESVLVIADGVKPVAVAGVMGGENSEIENDTPVILFESATFKGSSVRLTAKKLGMRTESSSRFEKGLDPNNTMDAVNRACELINMLDAGDVVSGIIDVCGNIPEKRCIEFRPQKINAFLGTDIAEDVMVKILELLDFEVKDNSVYVPTYRADVEGEADVAEEIARIYGYDNIPSTLLTAETTVGGKNDVQIAECNIKDTLTALGLFETKTWTFTSPSIYDKLLMENDDPFVISNPLGEEMSVMRTTVADSMLNVISTNYNYRNESAGFFEIAKKFKKGGDRGLAIEEKDIVIGMYGKDVDYYSLKGIVEQLFLKFGICDYEFAVESAIKMYHPGQTAKVTVNREQIAIVGRVHPTVLKSYEIGVPVYMATVSFEKLFKNSTSEKTYKPLPKFPAVTRDLAIVLKDDIAVSEIEKIFKSQKTDIIESYTLFDVYRGKQVGEGNKSVAYSLVFRTSDRTLTDDEVNPVIDNIVKKLEDKLEAKLRIS